MASWGVSWGPAVLWAAVLFFLSAVPDLPETGLLSRVPAGDKLVHLGLYAVLGVCLAWGHRRHPGRPPVQSLGPRRPDRGGRALRRD